jgi:hypothetical protein
MKKADDSRAHKSLSDKWHKSSFSNGNGGANCVEVRRSQDGQVHVRDSKDPEGPQLHFTPDEWKAFVSGAKADEFAL